MLRQSARLAMLALVMGGSMAYTNTGRSTQAPRYGASQNGKVVRLHDAATATAVAILPGAGNLTVEMKVKGHNVLRFPHASPEEYPGRGGSTGIPFLAPWADRLDEQAFYANGRRYPFDMTLGNIRGANPIHGFLGSTDRWQITTLEADGLSAHVTSRLEFFRNPDWMRQFPFAHTIEMTHRLQDGVLEVTTRIENSSLDAMPVAIGFHPYFQLTDSVRDEWTLSVAARTHWPLTPSKMPSGETQPVGSFFPDPSAVALKDFDLDDVFSDLVRDATGRAVMTVKGKSQRLEYRARSAIPGGGDLRTQAAGGPGQARRPRSHPQLHLRRTGDRDHQWPEPRASRAIPRTAEHPSVREVAGKLLDPAERV